MAFRFDATNEDLSRTTNLPSMYSCTMMGWFLRVVDRNSFETPLAWGQTSAGLYFNCYVNNTNNFIGLYAADGGTAATSSTECLVGVWNHWTMCSSSNLTCKLYINGNLLLDVNPSDGVTNQKLWICNDPNAELFNGRAAAIKIWNRELSAAEIQQEMWTYIPQNWESLNSYFPLFTVADKARDYSGLNRDLTITNAVTTEDGPPINLGTPIRKRFYSYSAAAGGGGTAHELAFWASLLGATSKRTNVASDTSVTIPKSLVTTNLVNVAVSSKIEPIGLILPNSMHGQSSLGASTNITKQFASVKHSNVSINARSEIQKQFVVSPHLVSAITTAVNKQNIYASVFSADSSAIEQAAFDLANQYLMNIVANVSQAVAANFLKEYKTVGSSQLSQTASVNIIKELLTTNHMNSSMAGAINMTKRMSTTTHAQASQVAIFDINSRFITVPTANVAMSTSSTFTNPYVTYTDAQIQGQATVQFDIGQQFISSWVAAVSQRIGFNLTNVYLGREIVNMGMDGGTTMGEPFGIGGNPTVLRNALFDINMALPTTQHSIVSQLAALNLSNPYIFSPSADASAANTIAYVIASHLGLLAQANVAQRIASDIPLGLTDSYLANVAQSIGLSHQHQYALYPSVQTVSDDVAEFISSKQFASIFNAAVASTIGFGPSLQSDVDFLTEVIGQEQVAANLSKQLSLTVGANVSSLGAFNITSVNRCDIFGGLTLGAGTTIVTKAQFESSVQRNLGLSIDLGAVFGSSVGAVNVTKQLAFNIAGQTYLAISTDAIAAETATPILQHITFILPVPKSLEFELEVLQNIPFTLRANPNITL